MKQQDHLKKAIVKGQLASSFLHKTIDVLTQERDSAREALNEQGPTNAEEAPQTPTGDEPAEESNEERIAVLENQLNNTAEMYDIQEKSLAGKSKMIETLKA